MLKNNYFLKNQYIVFIFIIILIFMPLISCVNANNEDNKDNLNNYTFLFNGENALSHIKMQVELGPRTSYNGKQLQLCNKLVSELQKLDFKVQIQQFIGDSGKGKGISFYNVIATYQIPKSSKFRLLGAHYDTLPYAPNDLNPIKQLTPIDGANDGASGVAILLELARIISIRKNELQKSIKLIFFDGEDFDTGIENMLYGSKYYVNNLSKVEKEQIEFFILFDMVGDKDLNIFKEINSYNYFPKLTNDVFNIASKLNLKGFNSTLKYQIIDDHIPFLYANIPALVLIDFDYPYWHTTSDTIDKVSATSLEQCGKLAEYLIFYY